MGLPEVEPKGPFIGAEPYELRRALIIIAGSHGYNISSYWLADERLAESEYADQPEVAIPELEENDWGTALYNISQSTGIPFDDIPDALEETYKEEIGEIGRYLQPAENPASHQVRQFTGGWEYEEDTGYFKQTETGRAYVTGEGRSWTLELLLTGQHRQNIATESLCEAKGIADGYLDVAKNPQTKPGAEAFVCIHNPLRPGAMLRKSLDPAVLSRVTEWREPEKLIERVRREEFPSRPSRLGAIFLAPDLESARKWCMLRMYRYLYLVEMQGNAFVTDGEIYTEFIRAFERGDFEGAILFAEQYWSPRFFEWSTPEIVLQGRARVIELVEEVESEWTSRLMRI